MSNLNKSTIEFSPAADLARNRDHPYKKIPRRNIKQNDEDNFLSPIVPTSSCSVVTQTLEIPKIDTLRFKPIKSLASRIDGTEYLQESSTDRVLEMLELGRIDEACSYADTLYATFVNEEELDIVALADYVKILTILRQWRRINHLIAKRNFHQIHIVFAYYAIIALFHRKLYEEVTDLPVAHLVPNSTCQHLPLRNPSHISGRHVEEERMRYSFANMADLDSIARKLRMAPALMLTVAECYLKLMNRDAAMLCVQYAINHDNTPIHVEHLMSKYNLVEPSEWEKYREIRKAQLEVHKGNFDPRILMERAQTCYQMGRYAEAKKFTDQIFDYFGPLSECMLLRIHCMTMLKDSRGLLELGHQLVADDPHVPLTWYCVAMYYYTIGANSRFYFLGKCTMMDATFAEAWVAFGHILHYEVEHEQSMSCYYRASKLVDRSSEPFLYVSLQYSSHSQKLSKKFMAEAIARAPKDPLIRHEEGCVAYMAKNYSEADRIFKQVLLMVTECEEDTPIEEILKITIDDYWRPMINNLGHISRKMDRINEAIMYHKRAIQMEPKFVDAIASVALCHAVLGDIPKAKQFFNRALAIDPFSEAIRHLMANMIFAEKTFYNVDTSIDISNIDLNRNSNNEIIPQPPLRTPFDDAYIVPCVPRCEKPLQTIIGSSEGPSNNDIQPIDVEM